MASRRTPLIDNPNAANSPLRSLNMMKQKRSLANVQREDAYGQQPPSKKQILDVSSQRTGRNSRASVNNSAANRRDKVAVEAHAPQQQQQQQQQRYSEKEKETILIWQRQNRARFPKMVFFFESVPSDLKEKLVRGIVRLGAREVKFFSNDVTHVVTSRNIPAHVPPPQQEPADTDEQPQTINPSLLDRQQQDVRRRLFADLAPKSTKPARSTDVLVRAQEMGKKVYNVEKLHRILVNLLEVDVNGSSTRQSTQGGATIDQMIESERMARAYDMEKSSNDMHILKGPFIYVYDMQERCKPIMAREYTPVAEKRDGEWPQFRSVANGRCPFVEDADAQAHREARATRAKEKEREARAQKTAAAAAATSAPRLRPSKEHSPQRMTGKRNRDEATDNLGNPEQYSRVTSMSRQASWDKLSAGKLMENPFTGKAPGGKLHAGEPIASGIQNATVTSAIRSQMISSTSGTLGAKAATSREMLGLQRKVLKMSGPSTSHADGSSRRVHTETSHEGTSGRLASRSVAEIAAEEAGSKERKLSLQRAQAPEREKRELKPGFCENCQNKFRDFDEHILSEKHRNFAEDARNWTELDKLLGRLGRQPKSGTAAQSDPSNVF
ncbi:Hsk1-interacting molecule 1 [Ceratocystis fimbriata CBS 114723]|uniref:Hsk1-interacting molecule 1 n=1 Tax=Ceratocystis fimbriata CBS 114723 TaxID=1035309 RepID=A0A2C5XEF5_9PEZI|nr:Hsk1-interacting molecule 1 [Ceratocystis fimbriata CBS 114723]